MIEDITIKGLLQMEEELGGATASSPERDAKVNMLKYLQIGTVKHYEAAYDGLFYELNKEGGLERLRNIAPDRSKANLQPKVHNLQGCEGGPKLGKEVDLYIEDAKLAKLQLDELIKQVVENLEGCEAQYADVKSRESTIRKAKKSYDGNVRKVADMARVTVVCETPALLEQVYMSVMGHLQVREPLPNTKSHFGQVSDDMNYFDFICPPRINVLIECTRYYSYVRSIVVRTRYYLVLVRDTGAGPAKNILACRISRSCGRLQLIRFYEVCVRRHERNDTLRCSA